jgi:hypothetical protein
LKTAGCEKIFREKVSGAHADRAHLARLLETFSISSTRSPRAVRPSARSAIAGPTRPGRTAA